MNPEQAKELGRQLRVRRDELGLSVRDLEKLTDVDNGTIVRIEQGAFAAPAPDKLSRIAEALGLSLNPPFWLDESRVRPSAPAVGGRRGGRASRAPRSALSSGVSGVERPFAGMRRY